MKIVKIRAVVAVTNDGKDYVIHGSAEATAEQMFKAITMDPNPLWGFDPANETVHFIELEVSLPEYEGTNAPVAG